MTDRDFLGLGEDFTYEELKRAYRSQSKSFHPDRNSDSYRSHLAMIRVNQAYHNLREQISRPARKEESNRDEGAYRLYKEGIVCFQSIHPSKWKKLKKNHLFNPHAIETDPDIMRILDDMLKSMARAYHCFSTVLNEFPDSCWSRDAVRRIREIESMTVRYGKIRKSYEAELKIK